MFTSNTGKGYVASCTPIHISCLAATASVHSYYVSPLFFVLRQILFDWSIIFRPLVKDVPHVLLTPLGSN